MRDHPRRTASHRVTSLGNTGSPGHGRTRQPTDRVRQLRQRHSSFERTRRLEHPKVRPAPSGSAPAKVEPTYCDGIRVAREVAVRQAAGGELDDPELLPGEQGEHSRRVLASSNNRPW